MKNTITLNENDEEFQTLKKTWHERARKMTLDTLPGFLKELTENYTHDYGTICHAVAAAAVAAASAVDHSEQGGITGFQAGAIMWEFIRVWNYSSNKTGLRLVDYDNFLYPQYEDKFQKTLTADVWKSIQSAAAEEIQKADKDYAQYLIDKQQYEKDIAVFVEKYPDYYDRKNYYDRLGMGTGTDWEEYEFKKSQGFEFAPREPYEPVSQTGRVYLHWKYIVNGAVPFGYTVV